MLTCTVIIALYNGEKYIQEQLQSILNQTHLPDKVIISDDGSSDRSVEIISDFIQKNHLEKTWVYKKNNKNMGYADNFWYTANQVETDILFFCDQDDIWKPEKIDVMLKVFEQNENIKVLGSGYTAFTDSGEPYVDKALTKIVETGNLEKLELTPKTIFIGCEGCTMGVKTIFIKELIDYHYPHAPHDEFVWKAALCTEGCYILHRSLMMRRFHANNVTHNKMHNKTVRIKFLELLLEGHLSMLKYAEDHSINQKNIKLICDNITSVQLRIELISKKKISNFIILAIKYHRYYHSRKAILMELLIALKG